MPELRIFEGTLLVRRVTLRGKVVGISLKVKSTTVLKAKHRDIRDDEKKNKKAIGGCHL